MKRIKNLVIGGIENKIFNLILITIIFIVGVYSILLYYFSHELTEIVETTNEEQQASISEISSQTMKQVVEGSLSQITNLEGIISDTVFSDVRLDVELMQRFAMELYKRPETYGSIEVLPPLPQQRDLAITQLICGEGIDPDDESVQKEISLLGNLSSLMNALVDNDEHIGACYIGTADGILLISDNHPEQKFTDDGNVVQVNPAGRYWFRGAVREGRVTFSKLETDFFTGKSNISCSCPVYANGKLAAVVGADVFLDDLEAAVMSSEDGTGFEVILDEDGHVIFSPQTEGVFALHTTNDAPDLRASEQEQLAAFVQDALKGNTGVREVEADGCSYYMVGTMLDSVGWSIIRIVDKAATDRPMQTMLDRYEEISKGSIQSYDSKIAHGIRLLRIFLLIVFVISIVNALVLGKKIVKPLELMTKKTRSISAQNQLFKMEDAYRTGDEIEELAESFASISAKTVRYVKEVQTVTAEKERIGTELSMAKAIQSSQLPRIFPPFPDRKEFDLFASMNPAKEVGGDFYDFFLLDHDHIALVMADVAGKGVPAALFMMVARILIKTRAQNGETPAEVLANVNEQLLEGNEAGMFVTVWFCILDVETGKGVVANAGHEHPALRHEGGAFELVKYRHSPAMGTMSGLKFREREIQLDPGDTLFVYTDGVPEATNSEDELFGTTRMLESLNKDPNSDPRQVLGNMTDDIRAFVGDAEQFDDITMLCLKYNGPEDTH